MQNGINNNIVKLEKEMKKLYKRYILLEDLMQRTFDEQKELDAIEVRLSQISKILENA
jgi:sulfur transfer complex TusBCD TusB component (DsrH family)